MSAPPGQLKRQRWLCPAAIAAEKFDIRHVIAPHSFLVADRIFAPTRSRQHLIVAEIALRERAKPVELRLVRAHETEVIRLNFLPPFPEWIGFLNDLFYERSYIATPAELSIPFLLDALSLL
jgi:hypothetical protein